MKAFVSLDSYAIQFTVGLVNLNLWQNVTEAQITNVAKQICKWYTDEKEIMMIKMPPRHVLLELSTVQQFLGACAQCNRLFELRVQFVARSLNANMAEWWTGLCDYLLNKAQVPVWRLGFVFKDSDMLSERSFMPIAAKIASLTRPFLNCKLAVCKIHTNAFPLARIHNALLSFAEDFKAVVSGFECICIRSYDSVRDCSIVIPLLLASGIKDITLRLSCLSLHTKETLETIQDKLSGAKEDQIRRVYVNGEIYPFELLHTISQPEVGVHLLDVCKDNLL